ncbi:MAG TPA: hypothetical protein DCE18_09545 [Syntrophobacteraceae bacterium]|nr:hypothetical protein [Syntrophobacteraceae bacterium]
MPARSCHALRGAFRVLTAATRMGNCLHDLKHFCHNLSKCHFWQSAMCCMVRSNGENKNPPRQALRSVDAATI